MAINEQFERMNYDDMNILREKLGRYDAGMLLDVAVGRGEFLKFAMDAFRTCICAAGIDVSKEMLADAKDKIGRSPVTLVVGSAVSMPFPDHAFDTVTMSNSLHHIENLNLLFKEIFRVCRPNGLVILNEMINDRHTELQKNHMIYHNLIAEIDNQMGHYHRKIYSQKEVTGIIREQNFQIVEHFIHHENAGNHFRQADVEQLVQSLSRRIELLRNTDHYYFYENKAREVIDRLQEKGFHKPKHLTMILRTQKAQVD